VCTIVEGTVATAQYVVSAINVGGRHSSKCKCDENGERSLPLASHTASMNSSDKSCEQSTKGRHGHPKSKLGTEINDETFKVGGNSQNGGSVQPLYRKRKAAKL
jgi:hypothetical protein